MTKAEITAKIEAIKKNSAMPEKQKGQLLAVYEKKLAELKEEPKEEPKKKEEAKPKTEGKPEGKPEAKTTSKPKRDDTDDDSECVELEEREEKAKKSGYDLDELLSKAKENKAKAKKRAQERASQPKKTPATRNREAVSRTTERVTASVEGRAKKGTVNVAEVEKLISVHEEAIAKLKKILAGLKGGKKMARGGGVGTPIEIEERLEELRQAIRDENISYGEIQELQSLARYIDENDVELLQWAGVEENLVRLERGVSKMASGGRTVRTDIKRDKIYQSKPSTKTEGKPRYSDGVSEIDKTDGTSFLRRNANQYYNDKNGINGKRKEIGNRYYYESANNRSDKGTLSGL
jgi:hypothetical protein